MKLYNPTLELIPGGYDGFSYPIKPSEMIETTEYTGQWILDHCSHRGLVDITVRENKKDFDVKNFIAKKAMEGINAALLWQHNIMDRFLQFDTDIKAVNSSGTVLNTKEVKVVMQKIKDYTQLLDKLCEKFGFSIATDEYKNKELSLLDSIDVATATYEADSDAKKKMDVAHSEMDAFIKNSLNSVNAVMN